MKINNPKKLLYFWFIISSRKELEKIGWGEIGDLFFAKIYIRYSAVQT